MASIGKKFEIAPVEGIRTTSSILHGNTVTVIHGHLVSTRDSVRSTYVNRTGLHLRGSVVVGCIVRPPIREARSREESQEVFEVCTSYESISTSIPANAARQETRDKTLVLSHKVHSVQAYRTKSFPRLTRNLRVCITFGEIGLFTRRHNTPR